MTGASVVNSSSIRASCRARLATDATAIEIATESAAPPAAEVSGATAGAGESARPAAGAFSPGAATGRRPARRGARAVRDHRLDLDRVTGRQAGRDLRFGA